MVIIIIIVALAILLLRKFDKITGRVPMDVTPQIGSRNTRFAKSSKIILVIIFLGIVISLYGHKDKNGDGDISSPQEVVYNSKWDGSVSQVKTYLRDNLKDPDSFQAIEWSPVSKTEKGDFIVRCKYRAKNSFGGYVVSNQLFCLSSNGDVISCSDF